MHKYSHNRGQGELSHITFTAEIFAEVTGSCGFAKNVELNWKYSLNTLKYVNFVSISLFHFL